MVTYLMHPESGFLNMELQLGLLDDMAGGYFLQIFDSFLDPESPLPEAGSLDCSYQFHVDMLNSNSIYVVPLTRIPCQNKVVLWRIKLADAASAHTLGT
ncbi:hypothetical protein DSO57_1031158 [Entomophthora muscae]|uniref:Uncharacterized protein n=1 Tax=Entomophthora muscae TaxID=34485 RepID=A0ACC2ULA7_9FUNG|nr:hypothetical protein DSO57_1031158 [Entomophthora muscae]